MSSAGSPAFETALPVAFGFLGQQILAGWVAEVGYWIFIGVLLVNVMQRRHQNRARRKRFGTLYLALAIFGVWFAATLIVNNGGADWMLLIVVIAVVGVIWRFRERAFPFRLRSRTDGRLLSLNEILFDDEDGDRPD